jgi:hypothetical protein
MGTVKRSPIKASATKVETTWKIDEMVASANSAPTAFGALRQLVESAEASGVISQNLLRVYHANLIAAAQIVKAMDGLSEKMFAIRDNKGVIENGPLRPVFNETERRTPKWKEEAIKQATILADVRGIRFNPDAYVEEIQKVTKSTTIKSFKVLADGLTD